MIIQIRGTSGTGKSTVVREVMKRYNPARQKVFRTGRKQPLCYFLPWLGGPEDSLPEEHGLVVVGHYETACGGCDTLPSYDASIEIVREAHSRGFDVLFEGLLISGEVRRCAELHADGLPYHVIGLEVPLEVCIASVNKRRWAKDPEKPGVNPKNTEAKYKTVQGAMRKLAEAGVTTEWCTREAAVGRVLTLLGHV